ncbi:MAG: hypothetical protein AB3N10_08110, partial [Allomuricauda sp.]
LGERIGKGFERTGIQEKDYGELGQPLKIKRPEYSPVAFPKSYHELNLLMLWSSKCNAEHRFGSKLLDESPVVWVKYNCG